MSQMFQSYQIKLGNIVKKCHMEWASMSPHIGLNSISSKAIPKTIQRLRYTGSVGIYLDSANPTCSSLERIFVSNGSSWMELLKKWGFLATTRETAKACKIHNANELSPKNNPNAILYW